MSTSTTISAAVKIPTEYGEVSEVVWCCPRDLTVIWRYWGDDFRIQTKDPEVGRKLKRLTGVERMAYCVFGGYLEIFDMDWAKLRSRSVQAVLNKALEATGDTTPTMGT